MSDQKPNPSSPATKADPVPAKPELAGKLAAKQMTVFDQIFIWTMVLLVGVIFGVGPSFGLVMQGTKEDVVEEQRREHIAQVLQEIINPRGYGGPMFVRRNKDAYMHTIRMAKLADGLGLTPSPTEVDQLVNDFMARKDPSGQRTYAQMITDHRRGKDITVPDLKLWLSEEFAMEALDARSSAAPALPVAITATFKPLMQDKVLTDQVVLNVKPLLPEIKTDDPEFQKTYETLGNLNAFVLPAASVVQIAAPDFTALLAAQAAPSDEQAKAWYEKNKADYKKPAPPAPDNGQTKAVEPAPEYRPFDEVKAEVVARMRREAAVAQAHTLVEAFIATIEDKALEQSDAAAFARAATESGLQVQADIQVPDDETTGKVVLPGFGPLKHTAREIGLVANKVGMITDQQQTHDDQWLVLRLTARKPASRKPIDDPAVRAVVIADIAGRRAYPLLLAEAEALRVQAEKAGPGGLRKLFEDSAMKTKWSAEITAADLSPIEVLKPPQSVDAMTALPEPRVAASLAVVGNPVVLLAAENRRGEPDEGLPQTVRLIQASGYTASAAPTAEERTQLATRLRGVVTSQLSAAASEALRRKL